MQFGYALLALASATHPVTANLSRDHVLEIFRRVDEFVPGVRDAFLGEGPTLATRDGLMKRSCSGDPSPEDTCLGCTAWCHDSEFIFDE